LKDKSLRQIYQERTPLYAEYADITINCPGKSMAQIVEEIRRRYTEFDKLSPRPD
jgi:shikimate kinase